LYIGSWERIILPVLFDASAKMSLFYYFGRRLNCIFALKCISAKHGKIQGYISFSSLGALCEVLLGAGNGGRFGGNGAYNFYRVHESGISQGKPTVFIIRE
jgi:hypothetical protein